MPGGSKKALLNVIYRDICPRSIIKADVFVPDLVLLVSFASRTLIFSVQSGLISRITNVFLKGRDKGVSIDYDSVMEHTIIE